MVSTASTNALPMNCPWRNKLSPSPRPRRGVHIVKVCPVDNIYLLCYTATCLSSIAGAGYSSPFPSHQGVHTRWFGRVPHWQCGCQRFESAMLHQSSSNTNRRCFSSKKRSGWCLRDKVHGCCIKQQPLFFGLIQAQLFFQQSNAFGYGIHALRSHSGRALLNIFDLLL